MIDAYREGQKAARDGLPFWANPYSDPKEHVNAFHAWFAGWCNWMKLDAARKAKDKGAG